MDAHLDTSFSFYQLDIGNHPRAKWKASLAKFYTLTVGIENQTSDSLITVQRTTGLTIRFIILAKSTQQSSLYNLLAVMLKAQRLCLIQVIDKCHSTFWSQYLISCLELEHFILPQSHGSIQAISRCSLSSKSIVYYEGCPDLHTR